MEGFLTRIFLNNTVKQWLVSAAFILGGFAAGKICSLVMHAILRHLCRKTKTDLDDVLISVLGRPLGITVFLVGIGVGIQGLSVHETVDLWIGRALESLFIGVIAWAVSRILKTMISRRTPSSSPWGTETDVRPLLRKFCNTVIWLIAGTLILRSLGYNVSALMAGLGLGGAALALASKDTLSNFFGSITVFVDRPFRLNDRIKIGAYDGIITEMGIRTSKLRTQENRTVFIPNSLFASSPIENISAAPNIKVTQTFNLKAENGPDKIEKAIGILKDICSTLPGLDGIPQAELVSLGGANCQASLIFYVSRQADYSETLSRVNLTILRRFAEAEISLG
ncbi:MAG: mechanosensitive ion channel family protein [Treponema sp.]|jgi:MscS family membrane protein|nr:mechanosensitive ion channel family protein [Treponema sp.]